MSEQPPKQFYFVMEFGIENIGQFRTISTHYDLHTAERVAEGAPNRVVWNEEQHDEWHKNTIMPYFT